MQKEEANGTDKYLTLLDELAIQVNFNNKVNGQEIDAEKNMRFSNEMIDKITYSCTHLTMNLKELAIWSKRVDLVKFFDNLNRLRQGIVQLIALTRGQEDLMRQANRFKAPMQKFLTLYLLALEEVEKHKDTLDPILNIPIAMESDIEEYKKVLEDDIMQDIDSTNHIILNLLKADPATHPKIKEILLNY